MQYFRREFVYDYTSYSFGYTEHAEFDNRAEMSTLYNQGYLPYSGTLGIKRTMYMARSVRVDLKRFTLSSENRRVQKKCTLAISKRIIPIEQFDINDEVFVEFCVRYFTERFGAGVMTTERLATVLAAGFISHVVEYMHTGTVCGYILLVKHADMQHYWFSFYDPVYYEYSLGLWLMIETITSAQKAGATHLYLGTAYGEKALYKTNFTALEYWDGSTWVSDTTQLRRLLRSDAERSSTGF